MIDLAALEKLAQAATLGPWTARRTAQPTQALLELVEHTALTTLSLQMPSPDAAYIAAANPATVLELIRQIRALESEVRAHEVDWAQEQGEARWNDMRD